MAERSRSISISHKWYNVAAFSKIYKQFINKFHHKKISASSRKSISKATATAAIHHHPKVDVEVINEGGIPPSSQHDQILHCSSPSPPPSISCASRSTSLNHKKSSRLMANSPSRRNNNNHYPPSPLNSSRRNNMFHSGNLCPSPLTRNRNTSNGTSLLRNISKKNSHNYSGNIIDSHNIPTNYTSSSSSSSSLCSSFSFSGPITRSMSQRSSSLIMYSNSNGVVKPPTLEETLECTLEELCFGCIKKIKTTRDEIANDGQIIEEHEEVLTIKVQPGWRNGTKITFEGTGKGTWSSSSNSSNSISSSIGGGSCCGITFTVAEKEHKIFRREGNDLEMEIEISLIEALTGCTVEIPLLNGEKMNLSINEVIEPGYRKIITGQGMTKPYHDEEEQQEEGNIRGNLIITFLVRFPTQLTEQQSSDIIRILGHTTYA